MIPDIDIWRCAGLMIKHYGDMRSLSAFYLVATMLAGCYWAESDPYGRPTDYENYRSYLNTEIKQSVYAPYEIRNAFISDRAEKGEIDGNQGWIVCVQASYKNRDDSYGLPRRDGFVFNRSSRLGPFGGAAICDHVVYVPFPELERYP